MGDDDCFSFFIFIIEFVGYIFVFTAMVLWRELFRFLAKLRGFLRLFCVCVCVRVWVWVLLCMFVNVGVYRFLYWFVYMRLCIWVVCLCLFVCLSSVCVCTSLLFRCFSSVFVCVSLCLFVFRLWFCLWFFVFVGRNIRKIRGSVCFYCECVCWCFCVLGG